jgi:thiol-disulfide isomerase/thioredoxin
MDRRTGLALGALVAAAAGGAGWLLQERRRPPSAATVPPATTASAASSASGPDAGMAALWSLQLEQPDGGTLTLARLRGRPLLVNFWATWCPPCVKELPQIDQFAREQAARGPAGWQVIGLAADTAGAVRSFLARTPLSFPVGLAGFGGIELARQLGNTQGGLPFTVALDVEGKLIHRKLGETRLQELRDWAA